MIKSHTIREEEEEATELAKMNLHMRTEFRELLAIDMGKRADVWAEDGTYDIHFTYVFCF